MSAKSFLRSLFGLGGPSGPAHQGGSPAASYKEWWNSVSRSMDDAFASTISPQDETAYRMRGWNGDGNSYGARQLIERAALDGQSRVLEIGCGVARIGREMAPHVGQWHGADISPNMLALARQRCAGLPNVVFHELNDVLSLRALPEQTYDFVYSTIVLMHLDKEDLLEYLRQAFRMLKRGGRAYFDTWNLLHPDTFRIWQMGACLGDAKVRGRMQCSTPTELRAYVENAGFTITGLEDNERLVRCFCLKQTDTPALITNDGFAPFGYVGVPDYGETVRGRVRIHGCCLDQVARIEIFVDGVLLGEASIGQPYPEVVPKFPRYGAQAEHSGFSIELDTTRLADGEHEIKVLATDTDGLSSVLTGVYHGFLVRNQ